MAEINFFNEEIPFRLNRKRLLRQWISSTAQAENQNILPINFIFCTDEYLLSVNKEYLKHDYYTDIITFDYSDESGISGDIYISIDRIRANAKEIRTSSTDELHRVIIHGVLHLLGYKDKSVKDKEIMTQKEDYYLSLRPFSV